MQTRERIVMDHLVPDRGGGWGTWWGGGGRQVYLNICMG